MNWSGSIHLGASWAAFRGRTASNSVHAHAAMQLTFAKKPVVIHIANSASAAGTALFVKSGVPHSLVMHELVQLVFIEPQSVVARYVLSELSAIEAGELPNSLACLVSMEKPLDQCMEGLLKVAVSQASPLDSRIEFALARLRHDPAPDAIANAAFAVGLSDSRLRTLARQQLGTPLSSWVLWRKLERAGIALSKGANLVEASAEGGFADQAHFTRTVRKLFGVTPRTLRAIF